MAVVELEIPARPAYLSLVRLVVDAAVGSLAPGLGGARLDDLVGSRFAVIARHRDLLADEGAGWWAADGAVLLSADVHPELGSVLDAAAAETVVVRPDRHLLAVGSRVEVPPAETRRLLGSDRPSSEV